ncbi:hypothetical protein ACFQH3_00810 [Haladaptatus sp. GCM10025707]|uniref:DUF7114 family protein n=1 Tax=unclassified Haladaptatus TaxID=2622732 RepID=UPI0023E84CB1|nr:MULTISPECIES: hypothetical protein [unclassified Haladaptatus]
MEEADAVRRAALDAIREIEPVRLRGDLEAILSTGSMAPGVLTLLCAQAIDGAEPHAIRTRAAGVQLIYEGLRLTRTLTQNPSWETNVEQANLDVLAADVLVSRGFHLLARTEAANNAVATVQAFGRDQTLRGEPDADTDDLDRNLERDVLDLALVAGTTAVGATISPALRAFVRNLTTTYEAVAFPTATILYTDAVTKSLAGHLAAHDAGKGLDDGVRTSATDP